MCKSQGQCPLPFRTPMYFTDHYWPKTLNHQDHCCRCCSYSNVPKEEVCAFLDSVVQLLFLWFCVVNWVVLILSLLMNMQWRTNLLNQINWDISSVSDRVWNIVDKFMLMLHHTSKMSLSSAFLIDLSYSKNRINI